MAEKATRESVIPHLILQFGGTPGLSPTLSPLVYYIGIGAKGTNRNKREKSKEKSVASPRSRIVRSIIVQN
jgi:hypothetical protein